MKSFIKYCICVLLIIAVFAFQSFTVSCRNISDELIRIHVIADSDSVTDQKTKLLLKDRLVEIIDGYKLSEKSYEEAGEILNSKLQELEKYSNDYLSDLNTGYGASVSLSREYYPIREYSSFTLPSGYYKSLIIRLGKGEGKNWWCVVYPELCTAATRDMYRFSDNEQNIMENAEKYRVSMKLLEWIDSFRSLFVVKADIQ